MSSEDDEEEFLSELEEIPALREMNPTALQDLEKHSLEFGMGYTDFVRSMDQDQSIQAQADAVKAIESEKLKMAGKKSRRERRVLKDQRMKVCVIRSTTTDRHKLTANQLTANYRRSVGDCPSTWIQSH